MLGVGTVPAALAQDGPRTGREVAVQQPKPLQAPGRSDIERLTMQIHSLEARSGRRAASVCIAAPPHVDPEMLVAALHESLGSTPEVEVITAPRATASRVVTVDFDMTGSQQ